MTEPPVLSVVVPSHNSTGTLRNALAAIRDSDLGSDQYEPIVVDDASSDASATVAARYADKVIRLTGCRAGPAYSRNRGVELARGEIVAFVNADVRVAPGTLGAMLLFLAEHDNVDAVSAIRGDTPASTNFVSQYWNLLVHFGERLYSGDSADLASGCGAVRRLAFTGVGMFDEWQFPVGNLEGVELAQRLQTSDREVFANSSIQVVSLAKWTVGSMCREIWNRGRMLARSLGYERTRRALPSEVVFTLSRAMPSGFAVVSIVALSGSFRPATSLVAKLTLAVLGVLVANFPVYEFYRQRRGFLFALSALPLHILAQAVSACALCTGWLLRSTIGDRTPDAATQAWAEIGLESWPPVPKRRVVDGPQRLSTSRRD